MGIYVKNTSVRVTGVFQDADLTIVDPVTVTFSYITPVTRVATTLTYGVDAALVRSTTGTYYVDIVGSEIGNYNYRWSSTTPNGITEGAFMVKASTVVFT